MKRTILLCFILAAAVLFTACGKAASSDSSAAEEAAQAQQSQEQTTPAEQPEQTEQPEKPEESTAQDSTPEQSQEPAETIDPEQQLSVILDNAGQWLLTGDEGNCMYAVTDLDDNGRLELIASSMQGSGLYTYSNYYEVSADGTGLEQCTYEVDDGESQPDIMVMQTEYVRTSDGKLLYFFEDALRNGAAESYLVKFALCLEDGTVSTKVLASQHAQAGEEDVAYTYTDADGNETTEEAFNTATANIEGERGTVDLFWVMIPSQEEIGEMIRQSYGGFARNAAN
ncbi:MAG: hypothetical protein IJ052_00005 [Oscillospiraceae bacterium]|nr:hypothetical protein [Oscillospiraceae bacterium]